MADEMRGFVFAIAFIIIFAALLSAVPADLMGLGETPDMVTPISPSLATDFAESEWYVEDNLTAFGQYVYTLGAFEWVYSYYAGTMQLGAKVLLLGFLWLGQLDSCEFISPDGENRGGVLSITEIESDAPNGTVRYSLFSIGSGNSLGGFVVYWNITLYADPADAWTASELYLLHGLGLTESATTNIGALIVSLLLLQLPDVPLLVNIILVVPIWASIIYVLWYIIKEMIPFV